MGKPTDINEYRASLEKPDSEFTYTDDFGVQWFCFTASYVDEKGRQMPFHFWATSFADAEKRLSFIGQNGKVDGQIYIEEKV